MLRWLLVMHVVTWFISSSSIMVCKLIVHKPHQLAVARTTSTVGSFQKEDPVEDVKHLMV